MTRFSNKAVGKTIASVLGFVLIMFAVQCSTEMTALADNGQPVVTVERLSVTKNGQPRVRVTTTKWVALLFSEPRSDSTVDDLVQQKPSTVTYRLPKTKSGTIARWFVTAYNPKTGRELFDHRYTWRNYKRQLIGLSVAPSAGSTDVYAEIRPKKGGRLHVKSVRVRVISRSGNVRWLDLTHAYTDEERGVQVYVRTLRSGVEVTDVDARTVFGSLENVSAFSVG